MTQPILRPLSDPSVRRIAVVRLRVGLGDLLASVPAFRALRAYRPDISVSVITWAETWPILSRQSRYVDELIPFPGYAGIPERPPVSAAWDDFVRDMHARGFDLAIQMYGGHAAANAVTAAVGARMTSGFFTPGQWRGDDLHLPYPSDRHEVHRHLDLVRFLGVPGGTDALEFPLDRNDIAKAESLRREHNLVIGNYAIVHPGATAASRRWPAARFAAVGDALAARGLTVVITGVVGEDGVAAAVAAEMQHPSVAVVGRTDLGAFAALLHHAAVVVTNDSGPAHVAHALGVPSVTIFMAGELRRWAAFDRSRHAALQAGVDCQPCPHQSCPIDFRCVDVAPQAVVSAVDAVVAAPRIRAIR